MPYRNPAEEATGTTESQGIGEVIVRKLTESQGARSEHYEVSGATGKRTQWVARSDRARPARAETPDTSLRAREHVGVLLRECATVSAAIYEATDPIECARLGGALVATLEELWGYRHDKEDEWGDFLNVLQILLGSEDFETMATQRKAALERIFREIFTARVISRSDVERGLIVLTQAGFDPWRGLEEDTQE
jgi:hypothetical protein